MWAYKTKEEKRYEHTIFIFENKIYHTHTHTERENQITHKCWVQLVSLCFPLCNRIKDLYMRWRGVSIHKELLSSMATSVRTDLVLLLPSLKNYEGGLVSFLCLSAGDEEKPTYPQFMQTFEFVSEQRRKGIRWVSSAKKENNSYDMINSQGVIYISSWSISSANVFGGPIIVTFYMMYNLSPHINF